MNKQSILKLAANFTSPQTANAHCDIPCGIYDPHRAILSALTIIRMVDIMSETSNHAHTDLEIQGTITRAIIVKEEHAEIVKQEIRVIWGDYIKPEHANTFPEIHSLAHEIMRSASEAKQTVNRDAAFDLLKKVNRFAEIFWSTKGRGTKRVLAPYKPELEIVMPELG